MAQKQLSAKKGRDRAACPPVQLLRAVNILLWEVDGYGEVTNPMPRSALARAVRGVRKAIAEGFLEVRLETDAELFAKWQGYPGEAKPTKKPETLEESEKAIARMMGIPVRSIRAANRLRDDDPHLFKKVKAGKVLMPGLKS